MECCKPILGDKQGNVQTRILQYYCERILFKKDDCTVVLQRNMLQVSLLPYLMESSTAVKYSCTECAKKIPIYFGRCGVEFWGEQKLSKNET